MSDSDMFYCSFVSIHYIICECGETFPSEEDLRVHLEREHTQKKEKTEYRCGICDAIFDNEHDCIEHYEGAHISIQSEHDYVEVYSQDDQDEDVKDDDLKNVIITPEKVILSHRLKSDNEIKVSENVVRIPKNEINVPFDDDDGDVACEETDSTSDVPVALTLVPVTKHELKSKPHYVPKNIVCEVCGKKYASNAALRYHQRVHTGEKPYKCTECTKSFTMPLFLQIHLRTHTGERPYQCPHCPKAFSNKAALLRHDRVHTGVKPYPCPQCGKFFTQSNSMKLHVNTVHLKMPAPYKSKSRRNRQKEKETQREVLLRVVDENDVNVVEGINEGSEIYVKPEVIYQDGVEDVCQDMITYEVIYEG